jgi:hypothetical protein
VNESDVKSPLQWWKDHIFSIAKIWTSLLWYQLGVQDLDKLVMICKIGGAI